MIVPSGNGSFHSRDAVIATSLPRMARRSLRVPSSWATEINLQSRYPAGILTPKIGAASSSACPDANGSAARMVSAMTIPSTRIINHFIVRPFMFCPRSGMSRLQLSFADVDDGLGKGLRGLLRQVVSNPAGDDPVLVFAGEHLGVSGGLRMGRTGGITFKSDGRDSDYRRFGKPLFQIVVFRLAVCEPKPPAIVMDNDGDVIGIIEGRRGAIELGVVEVPLRRGELPDELGELAPIFVVAGPAAFRSKIILVPPLELGFWRQWHLASFLLADQISAHGDEGLAAFGPKRRDNVGRPRAPIKTADDRVIDLETIHQRHDIDRDD